jgi:hypothetical protein
MMTCRCGGPLKLDLGHIAEAQRFNCLPTIRLLWKCCLCGHSLWLEQAAVAPGGRPAAPAERSVKALV